MSQIPEPIASFKTTITNSITSTDTTIVIDSVTDDDGNSMDAKVLGFVIDKGTSSEEFVIGTVDSANSQLTSVTRGVSVVDGSSSVAGLKSSHRKKASIEISDHPYVVRIARALNGTDGIDPSYRPKLSSDTDATDDKEFVTRGEMNRTVGGDITTSRVLVTATAGETIAAGNLCYMDSTTNNEWMLCDADTAATVDNRLLGIAQGAGTNGNEISGGMLLMGLDSNQTGMTAGDVMYAGNTAGGISSSAGTTEVTIGVAHSATELFFSPRFDQQLTEAHQDLLVTLSGITSSVAELNTLDGYTGDVNDLNEMETFFGLTDMTGTEAETLTDGSDASGLHYHKFGHGVTTRDLSAATGSQTIAHGLSATPKKVKITCKFGTTNGTTDESVGIYDGTNTSSIYVYNNDTLTAGNSTSNMAYIQTSAGNIQAATCTVDGTNITLSWTKTGTPTGTAQILWEAYA